MRDKTFLFFGGGLIIPLFLFLFLIPMIDAGLGYTNPNLPKISAPAITGITFNNNTASVNDSYWLRGLSPQQVANLYVETDPKYFSNPLNYLNVTTLPAIGNYWNVTNNQNGLTGSKNGSFNLTTTGYIEGDGGILSKGNIDKYTIPSGAGTRLMWIPSKYAFRAGKINVGQWDTANIGNGSGAFGENNIAKGENSFVIGMFNQADGKYSFVGGQFSYSDKWYGLTYGEGVESYGTACVTGGSYTKTFGYGSVALGDNLNQDPSFFYAGDTNSRGAVALGMASPDNYHIAEKSGNVVIGQDIQALTNPNVIGIGRGFTATTQDSFNVGFGSLMHQFTSTKYLMGVTNKGSIYHNGTDLILNPKEIGTGKLIILGETSTQNVTPQTTNTYSIGSSALRYLKGWFSGLDVAGNLNVTNITLNGNLNQTSGNATINNIYGEMYYHNDTGTPFTFASSGVYYSLFFTKADNLNGFGTQGLTFGGNSNLTTQIAGLYQANYNAVGYGTNNHEYHAVIFVNSVEQEKCEAKRKLSTTGDIFGLTGTCLIRLAVGDNVSVRVTDKYSTSTGNYYNGNINLVRIGN